MRAKRPPRKRRSPHSRIYFVASTHDKQTQLPDLPRGRGGGNALPARTIPGMADLRQNPQQPAIDTRTYALAGGEYINQSVPKDMIVLHATAGTTARSVYETWRAPGSGTVATAYVVDRDGTVYECFPADRWAHHLGMKEKNPGWYHDRRSIGIEIVGVGPLRPDAEDGGQLNWWPQDFGVRYCGLAERDRYVKADYRGFRYWASYRKEQVEAVRGLVHKLCLQFGIPQTLAPQSKRDAYDADFYCRFRGIAAHQNFRPDKVDVGPAWNWSWLC